MSEPVKSVRFSGTVPTTVFFEKEGFWLLTCMNGIILENSAEARMADMGRFADGRFRKPYRHLLPVVAHRSHLTQSGRTASGPFPAAPEAPRP